MQAAEIYRRASADFAARVHLAEGRWGAPTPCPEWDARALVNHLVNEERWTPPLLGGATIEEVGDRFDGDLLGADPIATFDEAAAAALAAVEAVDPEKPVHLSFGDRPAREYVTQLAADHLVHAWDLARALGEDEKLDAGAVDAVLAWFGPTQGLYLEIGVIGPETPVGADASAQDRLLAMFGRTP
ncbi:TIGR03086 family metal-binding protein [Pseudonocardia dioxanivorans]|uniref:TIGR03086 family metal-binding protein n=1 Tax=Pseudonocardia dioxanivorans TaxID=240495 RepID=UPI000CD2F430|nr:TIGR03086 family metal-binding protein [Pseudonocardia dioxanivorans]